MEGVIIALKQLILTATTAVIALFGQTATTTPPLQIATTTPEIQIEQAEGPVAQAYELGKAVGEITATLDQIEKELSKPTTTQTTLPNGAIIETDLQGNFLKWIYQPETQTPETLPTQQETMPKKETTTPQPTASAPAETYSMEIISPIASKGLGRHYTAQEEIVDDSNYIEIGVVVYNSNGKAVRNMEVEVTATDGEQNKAMKGTGTVAKVYKDGVGKTVYYYPFHYQFKTTGKHTITFTVKEHGLSDAVEVDVHEPDPA